MNTQNKAITREEFLDKKRDYSPLLVHLTRADDIFPAKEVLKIILNEKTLRAYHYYCLFDSDIVSLSNSTQDIFKVTCFTETPIDQIDILLNEVYGRDFKFESYGLVFTKDYIKNKEGNPVFYVDVNMFDSLWKLYNDAKGRNFSLRDNKVLAVINKCDEKIDFHWEREWRIVGNLEFEYNEVFCGLCPEGDIQEFEFLFKPVKFISPHWGINKILYKLVGK